MADKDISKSTAKRLQIQRHAEYLKGYHDALDSVLDLIDLVPMGDFRREVKEAWWNTEEQLAENGIPVLRGKHFSDYYPFRVGRGDDNG